MNKKEVFLGQLLEMIICRQEIVTTGDKTALQNINFNSLKDIQDGYAIDLLNSIENRKKYIDRLLIVQVEEDRQFMCNDFGINLNVIDKKNKTINAVFAGPEFEGKNNVSGVMQGVIKNDNESFVIAEVDYLMLRNNSIVHYKNVKAEFSKNGTNCHVWLYGEDKMASDPQKEADLILSVVQNLNNYFLRPRTS